MNMNIKIDDIAADQIVRASLREQISLLDTQITKLQHRKRLLPYEKEDLVDSIQAKAYLSRTLSYYGGDIK